MVAQGWVFLAHVLKLTFNQSAKKSDNKPLVSYAAAAKFVRMGGSRTFSASAS